MARFLEIQRYHSLLLGTIVARTVSGEDFWPDAENLPGKTQNTFMVVQRHAEPRSRFQS